MSDSESRPEETNWAHQLAVHRLANVRDLTDPETFGSWVAAAAVDIANDIPAVDVYDAPAEE